MKMLIKNMFYLFKNITLFYITEIKRPEFSVMFATTVYRILLSK